MDRIIAIIVLIFMFFYHEYDKVLANAIRQANEPPTKALPRFNVEMLDVIASDYDDYWFGHTEEADDVLEWWAMAEEFEELLRAAAIFFPDELQMAGRGRDASQLHMGWDPRDRQNEGRYNRIHVPTNSLTIGLAVALLVVSLSLANEVISELFEKCRRGGGHGGQQKLEIWVKTAPQEPDRFQAIVKVV